ncbi:MAG: ester cyclase [Oscillochloris sp.]|nr:ester cyclase [Oscillochloris sp.]
MPKIDTTALVRRAVEAIWNQGDLAVADILFASDYINHAGLITNLVRGPEAIKVSAALYRTAFPDLQISINALTAKRDAVLLRWTARSPAHHGSLTGVIVCRIVGSQISESWAHWDQAGVQERLGLRPAGSSSTPATP